MMMFGGKDDTSASNNDVQTLNLITNVWSGTVATTGTKPSVRKYLSAVVWRPFRGSSPESCFISIRSDDRYGGKWCERLLKLIYTRKIKDLESHVIELKEKYNVALLFLNDENSLSNKKRSYEMAKVFKKHDM